MSRGLGDVYKRQSKRSVKLARINIPTAIYLPHPMLRYRHIRNKGIIITLAIVSLLGKFI